MLATYISRRPITCFLQRLSRSHHPARPTISTTSTFRQFTSTPLNMAEGTKSTLPSELLPAEQANPAGGAPATSTDKAAPSGDAEEQGEGIVEQSKKGGKSVCSG